MGQKIEVYKAKVVLSVRDTVWAYGAKSYDFDISAGKPVVQEYLHLIDTKGSVYGMGLTKIVQGTMIPVTLELVPQGDYDYGWQDTESGEMISRGFLVKDKGLV